MAVRRTRTRTGIGRLFNRSSERKRDLMGRPPPAPPESVILSQPRRLLSSPAERSAVFLLTGRPARSFNSPVRRAATLRRLTEESSANLLPTAAAYK